MRERDGLKGLQKRGEKVIQKRPFRAPLKNEPVRLVFPISDAIEKLRYV
jgi:hypothetical protein